MGKIVSVRDDNVYVTTEKGNRELKAASTTLSVLDLEVLVLIDGLTPLKVIADRIPNAPRAVVVEAIQKLVHAKLIVNPADLEADALFSGQSTMAVPAGFFSQLTKAPAVEADGGVSILKRKGYYVRIARRPTGERRRKDSGQGWKPTILVIDDDVDLQRLIRTYFKLEGFTVREALTRDDIVAALRLQPGPDLVLLDVRLENADGFDILTRMRQHPVLKNMPVIMMTGETTREAVLRGLQGGADGYVTKPFRAEALVAAVKSVLGLDSSPRENSTGTAKT